MHTSMSLFRCPSCTALREPSASLLVARSMLVEIRRQGCWVYRVSQQTGEAMVRVSWRMVSWSVPGLVTKVFRVFCQSTALGGGNYWGVPYSKTSRIFYTDLSVRRVSHWPEQIHNKLTRRKLNSSRILSEIPSHHSLSLNPTFRSCGQNSLKNNVYLYR